MNFQQPGEVHGHRHVVLNITARCNQRCVFCFEGKREGWQDPSLDEVKKFVDSVAHSHNFVLFMGAKRCCVGTFSTSYAT